jgi:predicted DCC family thiol-disulfide oxidoreductase YuxK
MKVLKNHTLLYDVDCPLCKWYTNLFLQYNFLDKEGRMPFSEAEKHFTFDKELAKNKIALVNRTTGEVTYGIDSLIKVLGNNFPFILWLMKIRPLHWLLDKLYSFISYNRKIVIPSNTCNSFACTPSKSWLWRILFILFCMFIVSIIVTPYFTTHLAAYFIGGVHYSDAVVFAGQLVFQTIMCIALNEKNIYDYLGHVSFVSFLGALLLLFFSIGLHIFAYFNINVQMLQPFCYGVVFCCMFFDHKRRLEVAGLNKWLTLTWIVFRLCMYPFVFKT